MKRYILTYLFIVLSLGMTAQRILSIEECREMALKNNVAIRNAGLLTKATHETRKEAFSKYFPNIMAGGLTFTTNNGLLQHDFKGQIPLPPIPGLTEGGSFDYSAEFNLLKNGTMAGINLVQPVFMGGEIVNANKLAEVGEAIAELQSRQSANQVRQTVEQYYWQLAILKAKQKTVAGVMNLLDVLERQVEVAVNSGVTLQNDLLEVRLQRNEMSVDSIRLNNGINIISSLLAQYIGLGIEPIDIYESIDPDKNISLEYSLYLDPTDALHSTSDYQLLSQGVKAAEITKRMTIGANLPKIAVGATYFESRLMKQWHGTGALYATVIIPISDWWGGSHATKRSKLNLDIARNNLSDYSELLIVRMNNGWNNLKSSYQKIDVARLSIEQASENLRLNELYYKVGTVSITDLLKSQVLYKKSYDQYIEAVGEYNVEQIKYLIDTGR